MLWAYTYMLFFGIRLMFHIFILSENNSYKELIGCGWQILNAEEELKRRNSTQGMTIRPSVPLQVDGANDTGSLTRQPTPRTGSEINLGGDMEGGEADDPLNHNTHPRHTFRMSSMSPSSESPLRRPASNQHNMVMCTNY